MIADKPLFTRPFLLLLGAHFLQGLGWTSMLLLPMYMEAIGADRAQIGEVMAIGGVGGLLALPFAGVALDRIGRRPTLIAGTCCTAVGLIGLGWATEVGTWLSLTRFVAGVGTGTLFAGYFTFVSDFIPEERRTEGIALFGISGLLPLLMNPFAEAMVPSPQALQYVFPSASLGVFASLFCLLAINEPVRPMVSGSRRGWFEAFTAKQLRPVWIANITFASAVAVFMAFAAVAASSAGMHHAARLWIPYALGAITVRLLGARLPDRVGPRNMVAPAISTYALGMLWLTVASNDAGFLATALLCGIGHGYCFPVIASQVVGRTPEHLRGGAMALSTGIWELSAIAAQPVFGAIADGHGDAWCFIVAAGGCLAGLVVWLGLEAVASPTRSVRPMAQSPVPPN